MSAAPTPEQSPIIQAATSVLREHKFDRVDRIAKARRLGLSEYQAEQLDEVIIQASIGLRDNPSLTKTTLMEHLHSVGMPYSTPEWMSRLNALGAEFATKENGLELKDYAVRLYPERHDVLRFIGVKEEELPPLPQGK